MKTATPTSRILIVEDSPTQALDVQQILEAAGFRVETATDGRRGLDRLKNESFDLVVSDVVMPSLTGFELCRHIRNDRSLARLPAILLTSLSDPADIIRGLECGADNYLIKPYEPADLIRRVRTILARGKEKTERRASCDDAAPVRFDFMGRQFSITAGREQILDYFSSTFEEFLCSKQREYESKRAQAVERDEKRVASALARFGRAMVASPGTPAILDCLCHMSAEFLGCSPGHTFLWQPQQADYILMTDGSEPRRRLEAAQTLELSRDEMSALLQRLDREEIVLVPRPLAEQDGGLNARTELYLALRRGAEMIGFYVGPYLDRREHLDRIQDRIARGMAQIASLALENARLLEELDRANRVKSEFVNTMSHELRTPLHIIFGYTELLLDGTFGKLEAEQVQVLRQVDQSTRSLAELVSAALDLSRLEHGRMPLSVREASIGSLIDDLQEEMWQIRTKEQVRFSWTLEPDLPLIRTDVLKLKVVLKNLIGNAIKFTDQGNVSVTAQRQDGGIEFVVADTGSGIPEQHLSTIFECFRQLDGSMTRSYGGVGLGLYIARRLTHMIGGRIEVSSTLGMGSTFRVWVPHDPAESSDPDAPPAGRPQDAENSVAGATCA